MTDGRLPVLIIKVLFHLQTALGNSTDRFQHGKLNNFITRHLFYYITRFSCFYKIIPSSERVEGTLDRGPWKEFEKFQFVLSVVSLDQSVVPQDVDQSQLHYNHGIPLTNAVSRSLAECQKRELVGVLGLGKIIRVKNSRVVEARVSLNLLHSFIEEGKVDNLSLSYDVIRAGNLIILGAFSLEKMSKRMVESQGFVDNIVQILHVLDVFKSNLLTIANYIGNFFSNLRKELRLEKF